MRRKPPLQRQQHSASPQLMRPKKCRPSCPLSIFDVPQKLVSPYRPGWDLYDLRDGVGPESRFAENSNLTPRGGAVAKLHGLPAFLVPAPVAVPSGIEDANAVVLLGCLWSFLRHYSALSNSSSVSISLS